VLDPNGLRLLASVALVVVVVAARPGATEGAARKPGAAAAARTAKTAKPARGQGGELTSQLAAELGSDKEDTAAAAARRLGELGGAGAADALSGALALGLRPAVAAEALASLGKIRDPRTLPVVSLWVGNVNIPVRVAAVKALGRLADARGVELLLERLGDPAAPVRAAAAEALAARKEHRAEKRLFLLVARNDGGAAGPLGVVMAPDSVPRLAELHGRIDDAVLAIALGEFLKRSEVPDRLRLDVVRTLGGLTDSAATAALVQYLASVPERDTRPSKEEAQKLLEQKGGK
jgi:HEAT repeat protein